MLADIDTTFPQILADLFLIAVVAINIYLGWRCGLLRRVVAFAGIFLGLAVANYVGNALAGVFFGKSLIANAWCFVFVFTLTLVMTEIMAALLAERILQVASIAFDRLWGALAGIVVGVLEVGAVYLVAIAVGNAPAVTHAGQPPTNYQAARQAVTTATLSGLVVELAPQLNSLYRVVMPANLSQHLAEGTNSSPGSAQ